MGNELFITMWYTTRMNSIRTVAHNQSTWVNIPEQSEKMLHELRERFDFLEEDITEALPPFQRAKIVARKDYFFIVLQFPAWDVINRRLRLTELDIFLTPKLLVTVHDNELHVLQETFGRAVHDDECREELMKNGAVGVFFALWQKLLAVAFDNLLHINNTINRLDRKLFAKVSNKEIMHELMRLRTNIVTLRRTLGPQRIVLERLQASGQQFLGLKKFTNEQRELKEFTLEIWQLLESQMESSKALHEAVESVVAVHTGDAMKIFTVISVITFPLTLLATLFAVRAGGTPLIDSPAGFWVLFWLLLLVAGGMLHLFKKKGLM